MNKILKLILSPKLTLILLFIFAVAIGIATFIENAQSTAIAKQIVYNARWFEALILLIAINLIGVMLEFKLFSWQRIAGMILHLSFIIIILGAAITRYAGYEGTMHIREGSSSNVIYGSVPYLRIIHNNELTEIPIRNTTPEKVSFSVDLTDENGNNISIASKKYHRNAESKLVENTQNGIDRLEFTLDGHNPIFLKDNENGFIGALSLSFNNNNTNSDILVKKVQDELIIVSSIDLEKMRMNGQEVVQIKAGEQSKLEEGYLYKGNNQLFLFKKYYKSASIQYTETSTSNNLPDIIITEVTHKGVKYKFDVTGGPGYISELRAFEVGDQTIEMAYGDRVIELPFSLYLNDFILERYPGSNSPSSFESHVTLIDKEQNIHEEKKIYMNNILDHRGYRFFQSSYDKDEKGTVLSVNHDRLGTYTTYLGYFLMGLGFLWLFFYKNARIYKLIDNIKEIRAERKTLISILIATIISTGVSQAQQSVQQPVSPSHADEMGSLIVQTFNGRFQPLHTLATDITHKITKEDKIRTVEKGKLNAMQFFTDLMIDPEYWKNQNIIYVKDKSIQGLIGISSDKASFYDFFNSNGQFKLNEVSENAYRKDKKDQTQFDKEIIKVSERLNIFIMATRGSFLKVFPLKESLNDEWVSMDSKEAYNELQGSIRILNEDLKLKNFNYNSIASLYLNEMRLSTQSGNYERSDKILNHLKSIQTQTSNTQILPSKTKLKLEIYYNKAQIFVRLKYVYMIFSVLLLFVAFIENFRIKKSKILNALLWGSITIIGIAFLYQAYGLVLRWYISGHAPWSNGYEVLIFVSWVSILAGFLFIKYSKITFASTTLLAFLILMVAGFSNYDPQITNLQPVLKSYWLIIHVAAIVISYGFLGLGFILGSINLFLTLFKNKKNEKKLILTIKELSYINEINLIVGLILASLGTFLGAVWANESWGRYWGWDAKETWALIILIVYTIILHLRLVPKFRSDLLLNIGSVVGFGSVIMTFFGVNYYFTKGLHSYASGGSSVFPTWAWIAIILTIVVVTAVIIKDRRYASKEE